MRFHALGSFAVVEQSERRLPPLRSVLSLGATGMTNPQNMRGPNRVFWTLFFISTALIVLALFSWFSMAIAAPLILRDSQGYTAAQRDRIASWLITMASSYAVVLGVTNILWIAGWRFLLRRLRGGDDVHA